MYKTIAWLLMIIGFVSIIVILCFFNAIENYTNKIASLVAILTSTLTLSGLFLVIEEQSINKQNQFETLYHQLVNSFQDLRANRIGGIYYKDDNVEPEFIYGDRFFHVLFTEQLNGMSDNTKKIKKELNIHRNQLSIYYGFANLILHKIQTSNIKREKKEFYLRHFTAILTEQDFFLIAYYNLIFDYSDYEHLHAILKYMPLKLSNRTVNK